MRNEQDIQDRSIISNTQGDTPCTCIICVDVNLQNVVGFRLELFLLHLIENVIVLCEKLANLIIQ